VKFTPEGGRVTLGSHRTADVLTISVADTGIGIREGDQERIFEAFTQVDASYSRKYQGTGLGLTLVKEFAGLHGGRVHVESRLGEGSTFSFTIPNVPSDQSGQDEAPGEPPGEAAEGSPPGEPAEAPAPGDGDLILVVEDNPSNLRLVSDVLKAHGYRVVESVTGEEALDALKFIHPDLILMDIQLPGMDGLEVARMLGENPDTRGIPVVALTAHAMKGDEGRVREAGCIGYIAKPINTAQFPSQVAAFLRRGGVAAAR
jgi:CheY-like chemotaxis protein